MAHYSAVDSDKHNVFSRLRPQVSSHWRNPSRYRASEDSGTILALKQNSMTTFIFISLSPDRYQSLYDGNGTGNRKQIFMHEHGYHGCVP